jgi:succinyl-CoA synthetase alpha subunit
MHRIKLRKYFERMILLHHNCMTVVAHKMQVVLLVGGDAAFGIIYGQVFNHICEHFRAHISGGKGGAEDKIAAMEAAGIRVSPSPARLGKTLSEVLKDK